MPTGSVVTKAVGKTPGQSIAQSKLLLQVQVLTQVVVHFKSQSVSLFSKPSADRAQIKPQEMSARSTTGQLIVELEARAIWCSVQTSF